MEPTSCACVCMHVCLCVSHVLCACIYTCVWRVLCASVHTCVRVCTSVLCAYVHGYISTCCVYLHGWRSLCLSVPLTSLSPVKRRQVLGDNSGLPQTTAWRSPLPWSACSDSQQSHRMQRCRLETRDKPPFQFESEGGKRQTSQPKQPAAGLPPTLSYGSARIFRWLDETRPIREGGLLYSGIKHGHPAQCLTKDLDSPGPVRPTLNLTMVTIKSFLSNVTI